MNIRNEPLFCISQKISFPIYSLDFVYILWCSDHMITDNIHVQLVILKEWLSYDSHLHKSKCLPSFSVKLLCTTCI